MPLLATAKDGKQIDFAARLLTGLSLFFLLDAHLAYTGRDMLLIPGSEDCATTLSRRLVKRQPYSPSGPSLFGLQFRCRWSQRPSPRSRHRPCAETPPSLVVTGRIRICHEAHVSDRVGAGVLVVVDERVGRRRRDLGLRDVDRADPDLAQRAIGIDPLVPRSAGWCRYMARPEAPRPAGGPARALPCGRGNPSHSFLPDALTTNRAGLVGEDRLEAMTVVVGE
jgi:hypothetical protein